MIEYMNQVLNANILEVNDNILIKLPLAMSTSQIPPTRLSILCIYVVALNVLYIHTYIHMLIHTYIHTHV